jgi:hypothetical protein
VIRADRKDTKAPSSNWESLKKVKYTVALLANNTQKLPTPAPKKKKGRFTGIGSFAKEMNGTR